MARTYRPTTFRRLRDRLMGYALRKGYAPPGLYLLTVTGRKTGIPRTAPVSPLEDGEGRWLVAPYGPDGWVRNARAAGKVTLSRGSTVETYVATELEPAEAAPILKRYVSEHPLTVAPYFDTKKDAPVDDFAAEVPRHPVFRLDPTAS
jgi:deazaflavin-dependent oxidoreductase (nitroreductase family)